MRKPRGMVPILKKLAEAIDGAERLCYTKLTFEVHKTHERRKEKNWRVYGGTRESLERMRLYASAEDEARAALQSASGVEDFICMISLKRAG